MAGKLAVAFDHSIVSGYFVKRRIRYLIDRTKADRPESEA